MTRDVLIRQADKALAEGDYIRALELFEQTGTFSSLTGRKIQEALERMKTVAAKELAAGRWTVAEGIFDVMRNHQDRLTANQRAECDLLFAELARLREAEHGDAMIQAATSLAASGLHAEAREICYSALHQCEDLHLVSRLRRLLQGLPHPDGRLLYGFDSPLEIRQFCRGENGAVIEVNTDPAFLRRGCSAHVHFPGAGAKVVLLNVPQDWTGYAELNFWICLKERPDSEYILMAGDIDAWYTFHGSVSRKTWNQLRIPLELFEKEGSPNWEDIRRLILLSPGPGATDLFLDEMRLKPTEEEPPPSSS